MRTIHKLVQGSPEWHAHRAVHFNASEAPAMLGLSPYVSRTEIVRRAATGDAPEVTEREQERFDDGHAYEEQARPWAEAIIGEDLFPATASLVVDGLPLSASFDGATMGEDMTFEHKTLNQELAAALDEGRIPDQYKPQLEQQLMILGATRCLFMASNGDEATARHAWYEADPGLRARIIAGWKQFQVDVANYQHVEVIPKAIAEPQMALPAVAIEVKGEVSLTSNLPLFGARLKAFLEGLNLAPQTDQDFANLQAAVTTLETAEARLKAAEEAALARFPSIDEVRGMVAQYHALARDHRLMVSKLVETEKARRRAEILQGGIHALALHVAKLNERLGKPYMPQIAQNFAGAMKGKKTITSLQDAVATELSRAKIEANETADRIQANLASLTKDAAGYEGLFADAQQLVLKEPEHFALLVRTRVADHKAKEEARAEAQRERIRAEEAAKLLAAQPKPAAASNDPVPYKVDPAPAHRPPVKPAPHPSDAQIVAALAAYFLVDEEIVVEWLLAMDLEALRIAA